MNLLDWFGVTFEAKNLTSVQLICENVMNRDMNSERQACGFST